MHIVPCVHLAKKPLSSALSTIANFRKHLETVHKTTNLVEKEPRKRSSHDDIEDDDQPNQSKRQRTLSHFSNSAVSPVRLRALISEYIIEDMLPLSTVESEAFRRLIGGLLSTQVPDRKTLTLHLDKVFEAMEQKVKATLGAIDAVSTTADDYCQLQKKKKKIGRVVVRILSLIMPKHSATCQTAHTKGKPYPRSDTDESGNNCMEEHAEPSYCPICEEVIKEPTRRQSYLL